MALAIGNKTQVNATPGTPTYTYNHNMSVGSDGYLLVAVVMSNTVTYTGATYNGVAMTQLLQYNSTSLSQRWALYGLVSPATGNNNVVVSFSDTQWNASSFYACSFTGAGGAGAVGNDDVADTDHSRTLTVAENSVIYAFGVSINAQTGIEIDGSSRPIDFTHNTNRQVTGATSLPGLSAGSITVITKAAFGTISNTRIEIQEASAPEPEGGASNPYIHYYRRRSI